MKGPKKSDYPLLYALCIGDGGVYNRKGRKHKASISIAHALPQYDYLMWKSSQLEAMGIQNRIYPRSRKVGFPQYGLDTREYPLLALVRSHLYQFRNTPSKRRKRITKKVLSLLDLQSLAVWFCDDGYNDKKRNCVHLGTYGFTEKENQMIAEWIYKLTGATMKVYRRKDKFFLQTYRDAMKFKDAITSYVPNLECLKYKIADPIA